MNKTPDNRALTSAVRWALACGITASFAFAGSTMAAEQAQQTSESSAAQPGTTTTQLQQV